MPIITCTVFHRDISFPMMETEVGKGTDLLICHSSGGPPTLQYEGVVGTDHVYRVNEIGRSDLKISLQDWKTPAPVLGMPTSLPVGPRFPDRNEDAMTLLGVLVRFLGGSVTVSASDLEAAARSELTTFMMQDPRTLVLKVDDK